MIRDAEITHALVIAAFGLLTIPEMTDRKLVQ
jgi:hypothetical protein